MRRYVVTYEGGVTLVVDRRVRVPGGRVVHAASIGPGKSLSSRDGLYVTTFCDTRTHLWWSLEHTVNRLDLVQPDDAEVTCRACLKEMAAADARALA